MKRLYGSAASAAQAAAPKAVPAAEIQVGKASNGIIVASQESHSSLARVVCAVKAGARYEDASQRGVSHCLRVISDQTQREIRSINLVKSISQMGGNISCTTSREHLFYTLELPKDNIKSALPCLLGMVSSPSLRPWEISDRLPRMEYELLALREQPDKRVVEKAHEAAYRQFGLGRSIYSPMFQMSEFSQDLLREYIDKYFTADRISFSATGVDHSLLLSEVSRIELVEKLASAGNDSVSQYFGGEIRDCSEDLLAYTVLVGEGASLASEELWAFAALEQLLGSGPQIRWASNSTTNKMNAAIGKKTQDPFNVQSFNANYSDSGIFGVSAVTVPENSELVIKTVLEQIKELASKPVDETALQGAKNRVKATVAFQEECHSDTAYSRAVQLLNNGKITNVTETMSAIDKVTAAAVQNAAKKMVGGKLSMASVGEIHNVPYADQL